MHFRYLVLLTFALLAFPGVAPAQDATPSTTTAAPTKKQALTKKSTAKSSASTTDAGKRKTAAPKNAASRSRPPQLSQFAPHRIKRRSVAPAELKPMANRLITV